MLFGLIAVALVSALYFRNLREQQNRIERHQRELIELLRKQTALLDEQVAQPKH
jgi:hypothetical protein